MTWLYITLFILLIIIIVFVSYHLDKEKRERLLKKYKDPDLVERLMRGEFWIGQTERQLLDALGTPKDISEQVLKTKTKETWKYHKTGNNRYALKIKLENNHVVGWDKK
ncbi:DUF1700 domain-containing protein [Aquimarina rhabdastrellae]